MKKSFLIFFSIAFSVYLIVNYYIYSKGFNVIPSQYKTVYVILFLFLSLSYIAGRFLERKRVNRLSGCLVWTGSFWLAAMVYFFFFVLALDLLRLINIIIPFFPVFRDYHKLKLFIFIAVTSAVFIIIISGYINARNPRVKKTEH